MRTVSTFHQRAAMKPTASFGPCSSLLWSVFVLVFSAVPVRAQLATSRGSEDVTTRVSVDSAGNPGNDESYTQNGQLISGDGRFVVFDSDATNLVPDDTNGITDVFLHDRLTGETRRVSVSSTGQQANGFSSGNSISADGRYIAFNSDATNLVPGDTNNSTDAFVYDRLTRETKCVSVDSAGNQRNGRSWRPSLSADGRYVAFMSLATNLVPNDTNGKIDVFVHDCLTLETTRVSVDSAGNQANGDSWYFSCAISADGRFVAFPSEATNLVAGDTNGYMDVFVHDRTTGATSRVSVDSNGEQADQASYYPAVSADGRYVAFLSVASNLVSGDTNGVRDVFVHDCATGQTKRVSVGSLGEQGDHESWNPSISADGRYIAFHSYANTLSVDDHNHSGSDVFVHDQITGQTWLSTEEGNDIEGFSTKGWSDFASISSDGRCVSFHGSDPFLLQDGNSGGHVYVRAPELSVDAEPRFVLSGQTLTLTLYKSVAERPASLWAVEVNGAPTFSLIATGKFGADGNFVLSGTVPPDLGVLDVTFRGCGIGRSGKIRTTNVVIVSFG